MRCVRLLLTNHDREFCTIFLVFYAISFSTVGASFPISYFDSDAQCNHQDNCTSRSDP